MPERCPKTFSTSGDGFRTEIGQGRKAMRLLQLRGWRTALQLPLRERVNVQDTSRSSHPSQSGVPGDCALPCRCLRIVWSIEVKTNQIDTGLMRRDCACTHARKKTAHPQRRRRDPPTPATGTVETATAVQSGTWYRMLLGAECLWFLCFLGLKLSQNPQSSHLQGPARHRTGLEATSDSGRCLRSYPGAISDSPLMFSPVASAWI